MSFFPKVLSFSRVFLKFQVWVEVAGKWEKELDQELLEISVRLCFCFLCLDLLVVIVVFLCFQILVGDFPISFVGFLVCFHLILFSDSIFALGYSTQTGEEVALKFVSFSSISFFFP